jgi:hypothetical protein
MGLLPQSLALKELEVDDTERARLVDELRRLHDGDTDAETFARITPAPPGCLIEEVRLLSRDEMRRLEIQGESAGLVFEASTLTGEMSVGRLQV